MNIKVRTALIPFVTVSLLSLATYFLVDRFTENSFGRLENEILNRHAERVKKSFSNLIDEHAQKIGDWSQWDNTYDFIDNLDESYKAENLNPLTLGALGFHSVLYFDPSLSLRYGVTTDGQETRPIPTSLEGHYREILLKANGAPTRGLTRYGDDLFIFAAGPILPNKGDKPARGQLVATSKVSQETLDLVRHTTNLSIDFWHSDGGEPDRDAQSASNQLKLNSGAPLIQIPSPNSALAYDTVHDGNQVPALFFRVKDPRQVAQIASEIKSVTILILGGSGLLAVLLLVWIVNISVAKRVKLLSGQVREIARSSNSSSRLIDENRGNRSLQFKTTGAVILVFLGSAIASSFIFDRFFIEGFLGVEKLSIEHNLERATRALKGRSEKIQAKTVDWAQWDDTYQFIEDRNANYIETNLGFDTLGTMGMDFVLFFNTNGELVHGVQVDTNRETIETVKGEVVEAFAKLTSLEQAKSPFSGLVTLPVGVAIVGTSPILDTSRESVSKGTMVFAKLADESLAKELGHQTQLNVSFTYLHDQSSKEDISITRVSDHEVVSRSVIRDVFNRPAMATTITGKRPIFSQGRVACEVLPLYFIFGGLICAFVTIICVDRVLLNRIKQMSNEVAGIRLSGKPSARLNYTGGDEISGLASDINSMLTALEKVQEELREARQIAEDANAAKSNFVAKVSHELRTPIHGILGLLRIIKKNVTDETARTQLGMVRDSTVGLLGVVNDILDFSKAEVGNLSVSPAPMMLRETVRNALRVIAPRVFERTESDLIECVASIDPSIPDELIGDSKRISQLLINLLSNAVKFTKRGSVSLMVRRGIESPQGTTIEFAVTDTGIGIPADKLDLVFEPFKQADDSVSRQFSGTGLGLAIVKQLIEMMQGTVSVSSEVGKGSTFTLSIPLQYVGESTRNQVPLNSTYVWIINNASKETEFIGRALKQVRINAWCDSTDTLISEKSRLPALSAVECLIIAGNTLVNPETWKVVQSMAALRTPDNIVVTLSPHELSYREKLLAIGISKIILTPLIAEDILDVIRGQYSENYAGYDDYLEDEKPLQKSGLTMLVADDIVTNQIVLRSMLQKLGHEVIVVSNGKEALDAVGHQLGLRARTSQDKIFDIVFMDVQMPVMDGLEAIQRIRDRERLLGRQVDSLLPIIAVTAHAFTEEHTKMINAGADGILSKPIEDRDLMGLIERHQRSSRSQPHSASPSEGISTLAKPGANAIIRILDTLELLDTQISKACGIGSQTESHTFVDGKKLQRRSDSNLALCKELISSFHSTANDMLVELHRIDTTQDTSALEKAAHTLKGSLGEIGCQMGSNLAAEIVDLCRNKQHNQALEKLPALLLIVQSTSSVLSGALSCFDATTV